MQVNGGTNQKDPRREELTSAERGLVAAVKRLNQRRDERWQEKVLQEGTSPFFAVFGVI